MGINTIFSLLGGALALIACAPRPATALREPPLAFPGAEGEGKFTTGGRGGKVCIVSNLEDAGPGSLRAAIADTAARTIVFTVSGTIALRSPLKVRHGNLTVAGQSAPGDGICLKGHPMELQADNIIIRYLRFRPGDGEQSADDAITAIGRRQIIIDHCSMSWSVDECASFYDNRQFTLQWCIVAESLRQSAHPKGAHGYGGIWGGQGATFHHNLLAHNTSRNPRFCGSRYTHAPEKEKVDFRNNVIYNWVHNSAYGGEGGNHNMVNNYFKPGPATRKNVRHRIVNPADTPYGRFFVAGNFVDGSPEITANNWAGGVQCKDPKAARMEAPVLLDFPETQSAEKAFGLVLANAGASHRRDAVDARIVQDVRSGKAAAGKEGNGIIDSQSEVGGWPVLKSAPAPADGDGDGMPDVWEKKNGLDPQRPDGAGYQLNKHYTNLEIYLNSLI